MPKIRLKIDSPYHSECFWQMAVSERRDGGAASKTVVNRFIRTKVNDIFFYVLHITLVRWLSSDDDKALELTISTEVLNMTFKQKIQLLS